jgi:hypothetical protein
VQDEITISLQAIIRNEIAKSLPGETIQQIAENYIAKERLVGIAEAALMLGIHIKEARKHLRNVKPFRLGISKRGNRYRVADIIEYRNRLQ